MSVSYNIYSNTGSGDAVDYTTIIATTSGLTHDVGPLDFGSDWTFAIRAIDTGSGLEETNADARVRLLVGGSGGDLAGLPNAPAGLGVLPRAGGTARVSWAYSARGQGAAPTGFHVYAGTPTVSYGSPVATVTYSVATFFSSTLSGLTDGATYQVAVRAYNAAGEESNAAVATTVAASTGPGPVANLAASILS